MDCEEWDCMFWQRHCSSFNDIFLSIWPQQTYQAVQKNLMCIVSLNTSLIYSCESLNIFEYNRAVHFLSVSARKRKNGILKCLATNDKIPLMHIYICIVVSNKAMSTY